MRQLKREVKIGNVTIGGNHPIAVQTMLNVPVEDIAGNVAQAKRCEAAGCQILRVTCPSAADAKCIEAVKNAVNIPIVADIHFDYKAALACADVGVDKIRINPGNIGDDDRVKAVVQACQQKNIPIRIGVNGGSLEKHILAKYGAPTPEAMVESALYHVRLLEKFDFNNIVISIKNSNVPRMMEAYRQLSAVTDYPLHVGVTEAGTYQMGLLKSGMGIGGMLLEGIGDTIRVSLTADPVEEVRAAKDILSAAGLRQTGPNLISCPTCGRTQYPCTEIANEVEKRLQGCKKSIKVAVMGCVVNGPGEAREADIGIAGGKGEAVLFLHGKPVKKLTGLGDIGPEAGLPVMEGKAVLFKEFGGVDAFPICIDAHDAASVIAACKAIAPTFGGINLEDIKSPECFEIEETLERELDIPVFHDDQHGTAIVVTAALINALRVVGKKMEDVHIVLNGPGAAGTAIIKMLMTAGAKDIVAVDQFGTLYKGCNSAEAHKNWLGEVTNPRQIKGGLKEAIEGADVFIGVSRPGILTTELCKTMNKDAIVFAMANPTPEIMPDEAKAGGVRVMATGRSDFPNQVNNVLCFPGLFKGALSVRARDINDKMKLAAAYAIADLITDDDRSEENIIPGAFDPRVAEAVANAVAKAARESGVARL